VGLDKDRIAVAPVRAISLTCRGHMAVEGGLCVTRHANNVHEKCWPLACGDDKLALFM